MRMFRNKKDKDLFNKAKKLEGNEAILVKDICGCPVYDHTFEIVQVEKVSKVSHWEDFTNCIGQAVVKFNDTERDSTGSITKPERRASVLLHTWKIIPKPSSLKLSS